MPNTRRRRFSVQNDVGSRDSSKMQNSLQNSYQDNENTKLANNHVLAMKSSKSKNKIFPNSSKTSSHIKIVFDSESSTSTSKCKTKTDKDVTANSSTIDLFNILNEGETPTNRSYDTIHSKESLSKVRDARLPNRDSAQSKKEKHHRQHRIKVRSPKRKPPAIEQKSFENNQQSVQTTTTDWNEVEVIVDNPASLVPTTLIVANEEHPSRVSNHSMDDMCRICHGGESLSSELGQLISACNCRGTVGRVHVKCLERWLTESGKSRCELCGTRYITKRVHRYGVPRALLMWILSQNAKQLMVDSLGIMLMSPLAVLAAWLSGRTLAGLMRQDNHSTPWPLASTFVLACMTLVCYYCWIVSAATRHALGWWIWYRSQYEVRLQFQDSED